MQNKSLSAASSEFVRNVAYIFNLVEDADIEIEKDEVEGAAIKNLRIF